TSNQVRGKVPLGVGFWMLGVGYFQTGLAILFLMQNWSAHAQPGSLDPGLDSGAGVDQSVFSIVAQTDGKIIIGGDFTSVAGVSRNGIARLTSDGALDSTFEPGSG